MKKLRLLVTYDCTRKCKGCCNNDIKPSGKIMTLTQLLNYDMVMITGGEPFLFPNRLDDFLSTLHKFHNLCPALILYTATLPKPEVLSQLYGILNKLKGITFTIHDKKGLEDFIKLHNFIEEHPPLWRLQMRLNVFPGIKFPPINLHRWQVKFVDWIKNCPLPEDEEFLQYTTNPWSNK